MRTGGSSTLFCTEKNRAGIKKRGKKPSFLPRSCRRKNHLWLRLALWGKKYAHAGSLQVSQQRINRVRLAPCLYFVYVARVIPPGCLYHRVLRQALFLAPSPQKVSYLFASFC